MTRYAKGDKAVAECQRSGMKMRYRDLVEDGHIPGLLVHPDWWEPKHPQETPPDVSDPIALYRPAPEISIPIGEGDPLAAGNPCAVSPNTLYQPSTTLAGGLVGGEYTVAIEDASTYRFGGCVFIQRNDASWFMTKLNTEADSPAYVLHLLTAFDGVAGVGNDVYIGVTGNGALI